ncbi:exonuclease domain-containing protein [Streptomyces subrutilus]|uniref:exonuclease domain-containing protein n=1 Tax=Streptomyces subrutilus TaxID=36818 RepID=UPI002E14D942|nr:exonuclease domain-containing protein [Streptomyces subrutilus]
MSWHLGRLAGFDIESSGLDVETDRIVTACVVQCGGGQPTVTASWLSDVGGMEIPKQASDIHKVTTEKARAEGKPAADVVADILAALGQVITAGIPVVAMNAPFDLTMLDREARRHGLAPLPSGFPVVDPLLLDRTVDRFRKGRRTLTDLCAHYKVPLGKAHTADADAIAACRVAWSLANRHWGIRETPLAELHQQQIGWQAAWADNHQSHLRKTNPAAVVRGEWPLLPQTESEAAR